jgi:LPS sulfotransferase NodH
VTSAEVCRFVVLAQPRSGSWHLIRTLDAHPNVIAKGELLNPEDQSWWSDRTGLSDTELLRLGFRPAPEGQAPRADVRAVGFKVLDVQLQPGRHPGFLELLAADRDVRVIVLTRQNLAEALRSQVQAEHTGVWLAHHPTELEAMPRIELPVARCRSFFEASDRFVAEVERLFAEHRVLWIKYEAFVADARKHVDAMLELLGVPPQPLLESGLVKQERRPLRETVTNYAELQDAFRGTAHESFFP